MSLSTFNPHRGSEPGTVAFYYLSFFLRLGQQASFPLTVHETYKENNQQ